MKIDAIVRARSLSARAVRTSPRSASWHLSLDGAEPLTLVALFGVWVYCGPYFGIGSGSPIYAARALADLDPAGVGHDMMFAFDGQSALTLFTWIMRAISAAIGVSNATIVLAGAATVSSFLGFFVLARRAAPPAVANLALVFAAALPAAYGGFQLFSYAETAATPRPFAEALVLCGLAALLARRCGLAACLMVGAALLHPIMASPGIVVLLAWLTWEDRRWIGVVFALTGGGIGAACLGIHPFASLFTQVDPAWHALLLERNPHLFPTCWPNGWAGRLAARAATLLVAAGLVPPRLRRLFLLALGVGLFGLAAAYLLNERIASLLVLQAQTWRMLWLTFALANLAASICAFELWRRDGTGRIVLAMLAVAWIWGDQDRLAVMFAVIAVGAYYALRDGRHPLPPPLPGVVLAGLAAFGLVGLALSQIAIHDVIAAAPPGSGEEARRTVALLDEYTPLALLMAVAALHGWPRLAGPAAVAASVGALTVGLWHWDQRSAANRFIDSEVGVADLRRLIATRPGEVYWIDGSREAWWWLGRPQWLTAIQGAGLVFSRDLSDRYRRRSDLAIRFGLADDDILTPLLEPHAERLPVVTAKAVAGFCATAGAPAWIVAPLQDGAILAPGVAGTLWTAPVATLAPIERGVRYDWLRVSRYAVLPCAGAPTPSG